MAPPPATARTLCLSLVIVNYEQWENTARLVQQLLDADCLRQGQAEVVVVDNHSSAAPVMRELRRRERVSLRRWGANRGFARAANEGCRLSRGGWLLLLNPDVQIDDTFLDRVADLAERLPREEPRAGVVGFRLRHGDGSRQHSVGAFPTLWSTLAGLLAPRARRKYRPLRRRRRCRVPWVTGCCVLLRRACFEDLGGFDEDFFLYYEDVDLCRRAHARGWSVCYEPALQAVHHGPLHQRAVSPRLRVLLRHALLTYASKHWPRWQFQLLGTLIRLEAHCRRLLGQWRRDPAGSELARELGELTAELQRGATAAAKERLHRIVAERQ